MATQAAFTDNAKDSVVAVFATHEAVAESAIKQLDTAGVDMHTRSIVGQGYEKEKNVLGYYATGDRMKHWGKRGALWGGIWGWRLGAAFLMIPGIGQIAVAGPSSRASSARSAARPLLAASAPSAGRSPASDSRRTA